MLRPALIQLVARVGAQTSFDSVSSQGRCPGCMVRVRFGLVSSFIYGLSPFHYMGPQFRQVVRLLGHISKPGAGFEYWFGFLRLTLFRTLSFLTILLLPVFFINTGTGRLATA